MTYHAKSDYSGWVNYAKLEKAADLLRIKNPHLTKEQAIAKAAEQNPNIRAAYSDEVKSDILKGK